jgi:hypothetical protein
VGRRLAASLPAHLHQELSNKIGKAVTVDGLDGLKEDLTFMIAQDNLKKLAAEGGKQEQHSWL